MSYDSWKLATPPEYEEQPEPKDEDEGLNVWFDEGWEEWVACEGDLDIGVPCGTGKTKAAAIADLREGGRVLIPDPMEGVEFPFADNH